MRNTGHSKLNRMLMLLTMLLMVLLLSGCRTRLSNNTEVASIITDDDGWLQESYQERRDDLNMPVAKKPFFTGSSDDDIDDYYDEDMEDFDDYMSEPDEADFDEDVEIDDRQSSSQSVSSSPSARRTSGTTTVRRRTGTTTSRRNTTTKKKTSKKTSSNTNTDTENNEDQTKKQYTISFDGNGVDIDDTTISVEEGGTYGSLPTPPSRDDYTFDGWFTEKDGGTEVTESTEFKGDSDQTLYAHWTKKDPSEIWTNRFEVAANKQTDKLDCLVQAAEGKSKIEKVVDECKGNIADAETAPKCIIVLAANDDVSDEAAQTIFEENSAENPDLERVIIISEDSIYGSDKEKLLYKLVLLDAMHGNIGQDTLDEAASDLGISEYWLGIYIKP